MPQKSNSGTMPVSIKVPASGGRVRTHLNGLILDRGMDGYAVPQFSPEVYRSGEEMAIPMIVGTTGRESGGPPGSGPGTAPGTGAVPGAAALIARRRGACGAAIRTISRPCFLSRPSRNLK